LFSKKGVDSPDVVQLKDALSKALSQEKALLTDIQKLTVDRDHLSERLDKASYRYMVAEKKLDRAKSAVVQRLEAQAVQSSAASRGGDDKEQVKQESRETNGITKTAGSEELTAARDEATAAATKSKEHVEKLQAENRKLTQEITELQTRFAGLTNDDYAKTDLFQAMKQQHEEQIKRINDLTATHVQLREEVQKLQAERTEFKGQIEEEQRAAITEAEGQVAAAQADLTRIRNERDEILTDNQLKDATKDEFKASFDQMKELANARDQRITALETEVQRLKVLAGEEKVERRQELAGLSAEEMQDRIVRLESESALLKAELPSMEAAFQKYQALATKKTAELVGLEERATRFSAEKAKADQKYFGAMKAKAATEAENRTLRLQNSKSAEIITTLKESVSASRSQLEKHEKRMVELEALLKKLSDEHREMQGKLGLHTSSTKNYMDQVAELKKISLARDSTALNAAKAQREAEVQLEEVKVQLEATKKECEIWKARGQSNQSDTEKVLRVSTAPSVWRISAREADQTTGHASLLHLQEELERHLHQALRPRVLQRVCRRATYFSISQVSWMLQVVRRQRPHESAPDLKEVVLCFTLVLYLYIMVVFGGVASQTVLDAQGSSFHSLGRCGIEGVDA